MKNVTLNSSLDALEIIDQTLLPGELKVITLRTQAEIAEAIKRLAVRGAPAIGITAGYAYYLAAREAVLSDKNRVEHLSAAKDYMAAARPTAVNLKWALERMHGVALDNLALSNEAFLARLHKEAELIRSEDVKNNLRISEYGLSLLRPGDGVLTHCNAGSLATSEYGTSLGPLLLAKERGIPLRVFADETRPLLQGARLTAWELHQAGVDVTLICDNMANVVMANGWVQAVFVGCDRSARNGDCANKIGTAGLAVLARHYGIPIYFFVPSSTIDMNCPSGQDIKIEQREGKELISMWYEKPMAPLDVKTFNPAFDVTPHELISGIVTEFGVVRPPFEEGFSRIFKIKSEEAKYV